MVLTGVVRKLLANLSPQQIIDTRELTDDPAEWAAHCLFAVDASFAERSRPGDLLVLQGRLYDGPGVEEALLALQACGIAAVICMAAGTELQRMAAIYGLPLIEQPAAAAALHEGVIARLDLEPGLIQQPESGLEWQAQPFAASTLAAVTRAQLLARMRQVVEEEGFAE